MGHIHNTNIILGGGRYSYMIFDDAVQVSYWLSVCSDVALAAAPSTAAGQQATPSGLDRGHDDENGSNASDSEEDAGTTSALPSPTTQPSPSAEANSVAAVMGKPDSL